MSSESLRLSRATTAWTLVALLLLAVNLRAAISSVSPVLTDIQHQLGLNGAAMGVLTTLPVLCLGVFAAVAPSLARRYGPEMALTGALALITGGIVLRLVPTPAALFGGTALAGAGIAIGNVLMPYVIKHRFPHRIGLLTGLAMMVMSSGAALASGLAVPLDHAAGWQTSLSVWAIPAVIAVAVWALLIIVRRLGKESPAGAVTPQVADGSLARSRLAWFVTGFMGMQSLMFYVLLSWLPAIMHDSGYSAGTAGAMLSTMMLLGIPTGLVMPMLAARVDDQRALVVAVMSVLALALGGLLLVPGAGWFWVVLLGLGVGSAFPLAFTIITLRSPTPGVAARLSGMAQTLGYLLAGAGPLVFRLLHDATDGWQVPLVLLLGWVLVETFVALRAARPGFVLPRSAGGDQRHPGQREEHAEPLDGPQPLAVDDAGEQDRDGRVQRDQHGREAEHAGSGREQVEHIGQGVEAAGADRDHQRRPVDGEAESNGPLYAFPHPNGRGRGNFGF
jgi:CP family cyanate transporter-like MFS transporter